MNERLERFLEKTLKQMNLDETRTAAARDALRAWLEEATEARVDRGMPRERAETEALHALDLPAGPARLFNLSGGRGWLIFERLGFVLAVFAFFFSVTLFPVLAERDPRPFFFVGFISLLWSIEALNILRHEFRIDGGLLIRRWMHSALTIPFDAIREVALEPGSLFGARQLNITTSEGGRHELKLRPRHAACLTRLLGALAPEALTPELRETAGHPPVVACHETAWFRGIFAFLWLDALAMLAMAAPATWEVQGISPWLIAAWGAAVATAWLQGLATADPARRGLCWLTLSGVLLLTGGTVVDMMLGRATGVRGFLGMQVGVTFFALVALAWRGSRRGLLSAFAALMLAAGVAAPLLPPVQTVPVRTLAETPFSVESATWLGVPEPVWHATGDRTAPKLVINDTHLHWASASGAGNSPLEYGEWFILPNYDARTMTLAWIENTKKSLEQSYRRSKIWLYRQDTGLRLLDSGRMPAYWAQSSDFFWSPDRTRYILLQAPETSASLGMRADLKIVIMKDKSSRLFPGLASGMIWWTGPETLRVFIRRVSEGENEGELPATFEFWNLDLRTGEKKMTATFKGKSPYYACHGGSQTNDFLFFFDTRDQYTDRYDLKSGKMETFSGTICEFTTDRAQGRHAYVVVEPDNRQRLVVAKGARTILNRRLEREEKIENHFHLSPDGTRLFYTYRDGRGVLGEGFLSYRVLDLASGREEILEKFDDTCLYYLDPMMMGFHSLTMTPIQWTPDSRTVVYPIGRKQLWGRDGLTTVRQATLE